MAEGFNVFPQLRDQTQGVGTEIDALPNEVVKELATPGGGEGPLSERDLMRIQMLQNMSPEEFSRLQARANQIATQEKFEQAVANRIRPKVEDQIKARASAMLDKTIEEGKEAQKVKNAVKSIDELRELQMSKQVSP